MRHKKRFRTTGKRKQLRPFWKYFLLTVCGIFLFKIGQIYAFEQRGYRAVGGEYFLLLLPFIYGMISANVRDTRTCLKDIKKAAHEAALERQVYENIL